MNGEWLLSRADQVDLCLQVPAKPSLYVAGVLKPLQTLHARFSAVLGPEEMAEWCKEAITSTTRKWVISGQGGGGASDRSHLHVHAVLFLSGMLKLVMWECLSQSIGPCPDHFTMLKVNVF